LALAILVDVIGKEAAVNHPTHYQDFKFAVITKLPQGQPWELTEEQVMAWVEKQKTTVRTTEGDPYAS